MHKRLVTAAALFFSVGCHAATVLYDFAADSGPGSIHPDFFDQYHGGGRLTKVEIAYQAGVFIYGRLTPSDPGAPSYELDKSGEVGISFLGVSEIRSFNQAYTFPSTDYYTTPVYAVDRYYFAPSSDLSLFTGSGRIEIFSTGFETATSPSGIYTILSKVPSTFASGRVTYTFDAVPEPSSWAMIVGGVALVGVAMRRRQRFDYNPEQ